MGVIASVAFTNASAGTVVGEPPPVDWTRQSLDEAWWTGPLVAASASTLPQGHLLVEPYVTDSIKIGQFNASGARQVSPPSSAYGSFTNINYGVTDKLSTAVVPRFEFVEAPGSACSSEIGAGDMSLQAQYGLSRYSEDRPVPTVSVLVTETLPTGKYDRLDRRAGDGLGDGAFTTELSIYTQYYSWLPAGRILRTRLNLSYTWSSAVALEGASVYGTSTGFRGEARPGRSSMADAAGEYSVTPNWVVALDLVYQRTGVTRVEGEMRGQGPPSAYRVVSKPGKNVSFAPGLEYNWNAKVGMIVGVSVVAWGRNTEAMVTPVAAINLFF